MTVLPDGGIPPGILQALAEAAKLTSFLVALGGAFAWVYARIERKFERSRAEKAKKDETQIAREQAELDRLQEERQFWDERARQEIERCERERDEARRDLRGVQASLDQMRASFQRSMARARESWLVCLLEAARCRTLIASLYERPPDKGSTPPTFEPLPDPRGLRDDQA